MVRGSAAFDDDGFILPSRGEPVAIALA